MIALFSILTENLSLPHLVVNRNHRKEHYSLRDL